ncbi:MAG: hypothetical protein KA210_11625 [Bacteroidia bacterium]|nr:hypothetical protein [Bacteroidia bacterium]
MFFNKNLDQIRIEESQLLINGNFITQKKIPLNEITKVYVSVRKIPTIYEIIYILIGGIFIGLNFSFYPIGFYFWMVSGIYLLGEYLVHNYRTCTLNVELQNEKVQFRHIPYELKYQLVNKINEIKGCM